MYIVQKTQKKVESSKKKLVKTIELKSYKKLAVNFLILSVNLIIIILYFSLSQAKIKIVPAREDITHAMSFPIKESISAEDKDLAIEGTVATVKVEHSQTFQVEASSTVEKNASGAIVIYNKTSDRTQTFVKDTRFHNDQKIEIKIKKQVQVPPAGKITVDAYASEIGAAGEVSASSGKFQVSALPYLKDKIYAEISTAFSSGSVNIKILTPSAFNSAKDEITKSIKDKGFDVLSSSSESNIEKDELTVEIIDLKSTANPGEENIESFTITASANVSAFSFDKKRTEEIVKQELIKKIPPDKIFVGFKDNSLSISSDKETMSINASIQAEILRKIPDAALRQEDIIGMNENEVKEYFTKITGIRDVQIEFWPFWVRSVPNLKDHIDIEIKR